MVGLAGALVLNIGTLSPHWVEAMLLAGRAANERGVPVVLDPVGAGATRYRTETAKRILDEVDVTVLRGNAGEVATLVGVEAEVRGVESIAGGGDPAELAREAARALGVVASVTGPVDHVSDGRACSRSRTAIRCSRRSPAPAACRARSPAASSPSAESPLDAAAEALVAFGVAGEDAARGAKGPGLVPRRALRRARRARPGDARRAGEGRVRVHAIVADLETARRAVAAGATVVQLRVKAPTDEVVARGRGFGDLGATFVVNDDVDAALELGADGVHLGQSDPGAERARAGGLLLGRSARHVRAGGRGGRRLPRRRADLGDAVEGRRRPAARARRAGAHLRARSRCRSSRSAASTRRTPAACIRAGAAGVAVDPRGDGSRRCGGRSMRLSQLGELGLLAELERRGLIVGRRARRGAARAAASSSRRTRSSRACTSGSTGISWRDLGWRAAAVNLSDLAASGAEPEALLVTLAAPGETARRGRGRAVRGHRRDGRSGRRRRHDRGGAGRDRRDRDRPLRARSGPSRRAAGRRARRHRPARRRGRGVPARRVPAAAAAARGGQAPRPRSRTRCSTSPTASPSTPATSRAARASAA